MAVTSDDRSEIAFFDVETTVPFRHGQGFAILEFGAVLVCPRKLVELRSYSTLVRPADLSLISSLSVRCNGITRDAVVAAPTFDDIADVVYDLLHGRIWAGHNILRFDCARIREAFAEINRPAPEPKGTIDSLALLTQKFGRRAGDMKMASLATYFGLGQQTHRSLVDVRMNIEVLKYCATVLFLESSLPDIFTENSWVSPNATTRRRSNGIHSTEQTVQNGSTPSSSVRVEIHSTLPPSDHMIEEDHSMRSPVSWVSPNATTRTRSNGIHSTEQTVQNGNTPSSSVRVEIHSTLPPSDHMIEEDHSMRSPVTPKTGEVNLPPIESNPAGDHRFNLAMLCDTVTLDAEMEKEPLPGEEGMEEEQTGSTSRESSTSLAYEHSYSCSDFLEPDDISIPSISVTLAPFYRGTQKIQILYQNCPLQLQCTCLKVRFGISTKFVDHAGRPRLSFVVDASPSLCRILDTTDSLANKLSVDSGSSSEWRPVVTRKPGYYNYPTVRLHLPTVADGEITRWATEIYQKDSSATQRLVFSRCDIVELDSLFTPGNLVDAYFSLDAYDYQQSAGIRLVAKKLVVHSS
ncbi:protein NEN1 [Sesamum alatum]|uniref:Protein NEN1 n=1 Tax=Sesamum alatum TaxID=300844 RepID=A0AAE1YWG6_9LAMI|nr:protein NEN1 [Sesamum alatum]